MYCPVFSGHHLLTSKTVFGDVFPSSGFVGLGGESRDVGLVVGDIALLFFLTLLNFPMSQIAAINSKF
jgi:hypothetical protein